MLTKKQCFQLLLAALAPALLAHALFFELYPPLPPPNSTPILYSNQCGSNLRRLMIQAINHAKHSIHLVMFGLREPSILRTLATKAASDSVACDIYYDPSASVELSCTIPQFFPHPIYSKGLMHQKILVVDNALLFLGSANMTLSSLEMHDNLVLGMHSPTLAHFLQKNTPNHSGYTSSIVGGQKVELYLLPDLNHTAIQSIKNFIRSAKNSLKIAMFTFTHPMLLEEIHQAKKRGVAVTVYIDFQTRFGASAAAVKNMEDHGITFRVSKGVQLMHHKFLYVDEALLVLGSTNWTKAAFYKNHDSFIVLHHVTYQQKKFMHQLINQLQRQSQLL